MSFRGRRLPVAALVVLAVLAVAVAATLVLSAHGKPAAAPPAASTPPSSSVSPSVSPSASPSPPGSPPVAPSVSPSVSPSLSLPPRPPDAPPGPVILVPGYGGGTAMLDGLATRLRKAGRTTVILALPDNATGDLRGQEKVLAAQVDQALRRGAASVDLIGYSAGGIVVTLFAEADPSHVRRAVTLGSPLHGTVLAGLAAKVAPSACPAACEQMVPGSALLASLADASPKHTGVPWLSLWSSRDKVVTPPDSARFDGAENIELQSICADDAAAHLDLPDDPLVDGLIVQDLSSPWPPPSPSASDCTALRALGRG